MDKILTACGLIFSITPTNDKIPDSFQYMFVIDVLVAIVHKNPDCIEGRTRCD